MELSWIVNYHQLSDYLPNPNAFYLLYLRMITLCAIQCNSSLYLVESLIAVSQGKLIYIDIYSTVYKYVTCLKIRYPKNPGWFITFDDCLWCLSSYVQPLWQPITRRGASSATSAPREWPVHTKRYLGRPKPRLLSIQLRPPWNIGNWHLLVYQHINPSWVKLKNWTTKIMN